MKGIHQRQHFLFYFDFLLVLSKEYYNLKLWTYLVKWMLLLVKRNLSTKSEVWESGQKFTKAWPSMSSHIHPFRWSSDKQNYFRDNCMVHFIIKQIGGTLSRDASLCLRKIEIVIQVKIQFTWSLWSCTYPELIELNVKFSEIAWEFQKPQQGYFF